MFLAPIVAFLWSQMKVYDTLASLPKQTCLDDVTTKRGQARNAIVASDFVTERLLDDAFSLVCRLAKSSSLGIYWLL